jgi:hypothetical protein
LGLNPVPLIWTLEPGGPLVGETVKLEVTLKLTEEALPMLTV